MQDPNRYLVYIKKTVIIRDKPIPVHEKWQTDDSKRYQILFHQVHKSCKNKRNSECCLPNQSKLSLTAFLHMERGWILMHIWCSFRWENKWNVLVSWIAENQASKALIYLAVLWNYDWIRIAWDLLPVLTIPLRNKFSKILSSFDFKTSNYQLLNPCKRLRCPNANSSHPDYDSRSTCVEM